jgi:hypothetical protein
MRFVPRLLFIAVLLFVLLGWIAGPQPSVCSGETDRAPEARALQAGLAALARHRLRVRKKQIWTLIDYDLPYNATRLWVLKADAEHTVLMQSRVSHAGRSGLYYATRFSNRPGSNLSSLGSYLTARRTYEGGFGHSLRVRGLDPGINDNAWRRDIIFHPDLGLTHSLGCFMLPDDQSRRIIDTIAGKSFVYVHRTQP